MSKKMYPHRRQFVIGPHQSLPLPTWKAVKIQASLWLSFCKDLNVIQVQDANGSTWFILGLAIETRQNRRSPREAIACTATEYVPDLYSSWTGRWILIGQDIIHLDASGLLGCFYGQDRDGRLWASSSAALLVQLVYGFQVPVTDPRLLGYEVGVSWYAPPCSRFEGISRLLPSQVLELQSGEVRPRPLMPVIQLDRGYDDILAELQPLLITSLKRLAELGVDLWLGLTAGYDSRLMLALCRLANIRVQAFTRVTPRMSVADQILPPRLAQVYECEHVFIYPPKQPLDRQYLVNEQTAGHVSVGDAEPFLQGIRDRLRGISFGGHGFSVASGFAGLYSLPAHIESGAEGAQLIADLFQEPAESSATVGIRRWLTWALENPQMYLNWRDRFFIEQRQAGWLSAKEQLYDLTDLIRFPILNSAYLYSLLLSVRPEQRIGSKIQKDLLQRICPQLIQYPFNPKDLYFNPAEILSAKGIKLPQYVFWKVVRKVRTMSILKNISRVS